MDGQWLYLRGAVVDHPHFHQGITEGVEADSMACGVHRFARSTNHGREGHSSRKLVGGGQCGLFALLGSQHGSFAVQITGD